MLQACAVQPEIGSQGCDVTTLPKQSSRVSTAIVPVNP
jgi:hypothetical protein